MSIFLDNLNQHNELFSKLDSLNNDIELVAGLVANSLAKGNKLLLCGNGGSAADSQHIAAEFTGRFLNERPPIAAIALTTDTSALTCISNDYSFSMVFSRQISALGRSGDCLIGISTSGNSDNVLQAVVTAKGLGIKTIGLLGKDGGELRKICDKSIVVPSETTARIQEAHILIGHSICGHVEKLLGF